MDWSDYKFFYSYRYVNSEIKVVNLRKLFILLEILLSILLHTYFIAMYGYYFLAEMNWVDRRYGGKFITPMQLAQFLLCMVFNAAETFRLEQCGSDWRVVAYMWFTYLIFFGFFWKIYTTKREARHSDKYFNILLTFRILISSNCSLEDLMPLRPLQLPIPLTPLLALPLRSKPKLIRCLLVINVLIKYLHHKNHKFLT